MRKIVFDNDAFEDFCNWAVYDKKVFRKIIELFKSINRTPNKGIGKPEALKFNKSGY